MRTQKPRTNPVQERNDLHVDETRDVFVVNLSVDYSAPWWNSCVSDAPDVRMRAGSV